MDAKNLFEKYPTITEFYFTTDGVAWYSEEDAKRHHSLMGTPDAPVECVKRDEPAAPEMKGAIPQTSENVEAETTETTEEANDTEIVSANSLI
jgi:hypothetical protein